MSNLEKLQGGSWTDKFLPNPAAEIFRDQCAMVPFVLSSSSESEHVFIEEESPVIEQVVNEEMFPEYEHASAADNVQFVTKEELEEVKKNQEDLAKGQEKILKDNAEIKNLLQLLISRIPPS